MNNTLKIFLPLAAACFVSSCSLFTPKGDVVKADSTNVVEGSNGSNSVVVNNEKQNTTQPASKHTPANQVQSSVVKNKVIEYLVGEWQIVKADDKKIVTEEEMPYINFVPDEKRFYASNGCNIINGMFEASGESSITFSNVLTTMKSCDDAAYESVINQVLRDGNTVKVAVENKDKNVYLTLTSLSQKKLLLKRNNLSLIAGEWKVSQIGDQKIDIPDVNIFFNTDDLTVHGNTGCNYFNGELYADPHGEDAISFSHMAVTMRMCPYSDIEMSMLVSLEQAVSFDLTNKGTMYLLDAKGKKLMILHR